MLAEIAPKNLKEQARALGESRQVVGWHLIYIPLVPRPDLQRASPKTPRPRLEDAAPPIARRVVGVPAELNYRYPFLTPFADSRESRRKEKVTEWPD
jgi:hypothetical protein